MINKIGIKALIFLLIVGCLIISVLEMYRIGCFVDMYNYTPFAIFGNTWIWYLLWVRLALLTFVLILNFK